jgi:hypothetical protein
LTDKRKYYLFAANKDERAMWMAGFDFVLKNNEEHCRKIKENDL